MYAFKLIAPLCDLARESKLHMYTFTVNTQKRAKVSILSRWRAELFLLHHLVGRHCLMYD